MSVPVVEKPVISPYNPGLPSIHHSMNSIDNLENMLCKVDVVGVLFNPNILHKSGKQARLQSFGK